jgi:predicted amino acid-binding ACT domain protein
MHLWHSGGRRFILFRPGGKIRRMDTLKNHAYVLNVMSNDHPGIVAAVGKAVCEANGNMDAVSQTVLEGFFTLIMIVSFPEAIDPEELSQRIETDHPGFQVTIRPFESLDWTSEQRGRFVVTAFGADRPGIVLRFSQYLAGKDINIVDLFGHREGEEFVLIGQVEVPKRLDVALLQADLEEMGREEGYNVRLQHENIFVATNQLRLVHA